jgi:hypothetical protein
MPIFAWCFTMMRVSLVAAKQKAATRYETGEEADGQAAEEVGVILLCASWRCAK